MKTTIFTPILTTKTTVVAINNCGNSSRGTLFNSYTSYFSYGIVLYILGFVLVFNLFSSVLQSTQKKNFLLIAVNELLKGG